VVRTVRKNERYELDSDDSEDAELLLDALDADDSELALDSLEDEESGPVGLPLLQPPRAPTPASAAPPDSRIRNSRRSDRRPFSEAGSGTPSLFSVMTPLPQGVEVFPMQLLRVSTASVALIWPLRQQAPCRGQPRARPIATRQSPVALSGPVASNCDAAHSSECGDSPKSPSGQGSNVRVA
jgi:hypothetical protein